MERIGKVARSRTTYAILAMFFVGGINAIAEFIPPAFLPYVQGALGLLTLYFKQSPSQNYSE